MSTDDAADQLAKLIALRDAGELTDAEFDRERTAMGLPEVSGSTGFAAVDPTAWKAMPHHRGRRAAALFVLAVTIVIAAGPLIALYVLSDGSPNVSSSDVTPSQVPAQPTQAIQPTPADPYAASIGETIELADAGNAHLGSVAVVEADKPIELIGLEPDAGYRYVAARVSYIAVTPLDFNMFDWSAHDADLVQYEPIAYTPSPALSFGTLQAGREVEGWVAFQVAQDAEGIWLDYRSLPGAGTVIFSVKID